MFTNADVFQMISAPRRPASTLAVAKTAAYSAVIWNYAMVVRCQVTASYLLGCLRFLASSNMCCVAKEDWSSSNDSRVF